MSSADTSLIKLDAGTLTLGGTNAITSWDLCGGTTTIMGSNSPSMAMEIVASMWG